ncbi:MAG: heme NO-binding domain-containing protein [Myxococcota bacterium]
MYGLVNQAMQDLVVARHGQETWDRIRAAANVPHERFAAMTAYDDAVTYRLVGVASEVLDVPVPELLHAFGRYWVQYTASAGYGRLLTMAGDDLPTFLSQLDALHARVGLTCPELRPPGFRVDRDGDDLVLHYWSDRPGLAPMVVGLIEGLGERFGTPVAATLERSRADGADHDVFRIRTAAPGP